ncbi:hypothetical protein COLO4_06145 [Corchorus olitorius]|uniref:F-box domain-containing protein n=1 Tax=Corchorus olitorius TaxID=93759 RepID=A0A1R3KNW3_9ROSI|nr:hypothetical protein COLO4_06145 [Corchorus olitorius]
MSKFRIPESDDDFGCVDRISELPDDVLFQILSYLPTTDIIATSALLNVE